MHTQIISAFSNNGYKTYGHRLVNTYNHLNVNIPMSIYTEGVTAKLSNVEKRNQLAIPGLVEFLNRHSDNPLYCGKQPTGKWREKEKRNGYSYRTDAYKFCRMVYSIWDGAVKLNKGLMIWLDGDCLFRRSLPDDFSDKLISDNIAYSYLGRTRKYTETGFLAFKLPEALPIIQRWRDIYNNDEMQNYTEWHSAFLFDRAREEFSELQGYDLTNGCESGHAIHHSWVGKYIDHLKGVRKLRGRSWEASR